jgi:eukaryotic-like serine/threonine-protein kinase
VARLCHPHITAVYDYGESTSTDGTSVPYVVMELVDGVPLSARLAGGGLPWTEAVTICAQVAAALATAHANGIVHRDVTPANVMLTRGGPKVVDFGISALAGEQDTSPDGSLFGTPAYLAPERLDGGPVEPATDVYALGVLLYKALAGRLPWPMMNTTQMLKAHRLAEPAPLPSPVAAEVPPEVVDLCWRCLAKRPQDRPPSEEVARTLADAVRIVVPLPAREPVHGGPVHLDTTEESTLSWPIEPQDETADPKGDERDDGDGVRRRNAIVAVAALVLLTLAAWARASAPDGVPAAGSAAAGAAAAPEQRCRVDYQVSQDWGSGFKARVAVTNLGAAELRDWRLAFAFASDQRVTAAQAATWNQSGHTVVARPSGSDARLYPGGRAEMGFTGRYTRANPLPAAESFDLDGARCQTVVLIPAAPATPTPTPSPKDSHSTDPGKGGEKDGGKNHGKGGGKDA